MNTQKVKSQEIGTIGKIIIPKDVETIIDYLHKTIGATEWSGILFYKLTKGDISRLKNLEFTAQFIYPMNIGSSAYTEFDYNSEVMSAYDVHEDAITCSTGLIHTHHSMGAFHSETDISEMTDNAKSFNYYVSLVVDFKKEYKCKIAFPSKTKTTQKYQIRNSEGKFISVTKSFEEDNIIIGDLNIEFENKIVTPQWLNERVKELKVKKAIIPVKPFTTSTTYPAKVNVSTYAPKSYRDYDFYQGYSETTTPVKTFVTPKEFLCALINLDESGNKLGLETTIMEVETTIGIEEVDYDNYDAVLSNNIEIIHDSVYGNDNLFKNHCQSALSVLENNEQLFSDQTLYQIIKENIKLYAS